MYKKIQIAEYRRKEGRKKGTRTQDLFLIYNIYDIYNRGNYFTEYPGGEGWQLFFKGFFGFLSFQMNKFVFFTF